MVAELADDRGALDLAREAAGMVLALAARLQEGYAAHAAGVGLTAAQAKLLVALQPDEAVPMRALAERTASDPSNLTVLVDRLETAGLVRRRPRPSDRRVKELLLTSRGLERRAAFMEVLHSDAGPLGNLAPEELRELHDALAVALGGDARAVPDATA